MRFALIGPILVSILSTTYAWDWKCSFCTWSGISSSFTPLDTLDWGPVTMCVPRLSLAEKGSLVHHIYMGWTSMDQIFC